MQLSLETPRWPAPTRRCTQRSKVLVSVPAALGIITEQNVFFYPLEGYVLCVCWDATSTAPNTVAILPMWSVLHSLHTCMQYGSGRQGQASMC